MKFPIFLSPIFHIKDFCLIPLFQTCSFPDPLITHTFEHFFFFSTEIRFFHFHLRTRCPKMDDCLWGWICLLSCDWRSFLLKSFLLSQGQCWFWGVIGTYWWWFWFWSFCSDWETQTFLGWRKGKGRIWFPSTFGVVFGEGWLN